jgi:hypothetical protein
MDHRIRTRRCMPQVTAAAEAEGSRIFQVSRVNFPISLVVPGMEEERALKMQFHNPAPMPRRTHPLNHRMAADRIGPFHQSPVQTNLRSTHRPTHHPTRRATPSHLEATNLLTIHRSSSGLAVGTVMLGVDLGARSPGNRSRKLKTRE